MKLISCLSPMLDNDEMENDKISEKYYRRSSVITSHHCKNKNNINKNSQNLCCPRCSCVIDEYKQTRMSVLRQKYNESQSVEIETCINREVIQKIEPVSDEELNNINNLILKFENKPKEECNRRSSSAHLEKSETNNYCDKNFDKCVNNDEVCEKNDENSIDASSENVNIKDDSEKVEIRQFSRFAALDISTSIPEIPQNSSNRLTNLSTKSNSDSQLERNSKDFHTNFSSYQNTSLENTNKIVNNEVNSDTKSNKALDVIKEIVETERNYVESLRCIVEEYIPELQRKDIIQGLRGQKFSLFCNVEKIYDFHKNIFLKDLTECLSDWTKIGNCFLKNEKKFDLYVLYNKNKPKSDALMADYGYFFEEKRRILNHPLNLSSQLLEPVQRLTRYTLLLDKLLKECDIDCYAYKNIFNAKELIVYTLRHGDDLLYMDGIKNCDINLDDQGKLLRQERFFVVEENVKKSVEHRLFLFEDLILFSVPNKLNKNEYNYRLSWKMTDVGLTDYGDQTKFIIWFRKYQKNKFTLDAINSKIKMEWVQEINSILWKQATHYKLTKEKELAALGINQTRIPIQEEESDEDERTSNKKYYSTRSLRGVAGEIKPKKVLDRTTWYCTIRTEEMENS